jgi:salicylate synthetase
VPLGADPILGGIALARRCAASPDGDAFVLYERDDAVLFAAGRHAELVVDYDGLRVTTTDGTRVTPFGDQPLRDISSVISEITEADRRAYGWAAFELGHLLHGFGRPPGTDPLLHLVVPRWEARLRPGSAELRATDGNDLAGWQDALRHAEPDGYRERIPVDEVTDSDGYRDTVSSALRDIHDARLHKVILSRAVTVHGDVDLVSSFEMARRHNTPARSFVLQLGSLRFAGVSPETIVEVAPDGTLSTHPLAGTRARHGDDAIDAVLREELLTDPKEVYEHAVSVQLSRDEVGEVSEPGSVVVEDFMDVVPRGSVQHLGSRVRGRLRPDATCWDAFARLFPAVTVTGIPKRAACEVIGRCETGPRGVYGGAVLTVDHNGALDAALVLRSIYQQHGRTWLRAGAGIVAQSSPERELEETREKLRSVSRYLVAAPPDGGRS